MTDSTDHPVMQNIEAALEALLFSAPGPVTLQQMAAALNLPGEQIKGGLQRLDEDYQARRGLRLQEHAGKYQLTTAPELAGLIETFLGLEATSRLSRAALETLAIIAYQQPVTRPQMDSIRGVNSDGVVKSLLTKGLIEEGGRADGPGRPILYGTTEEFLQHFGLSSLNELPPLNLEEAQPPVTQELLKD
jgi:segregation and condensation protein B